MEKKIKWIWILLAGLMISNIFLFVVTIRLFYQPSISYPIGGFSTGVYFSSGSEGETYTTGVERISKDGSIHRIYFWTPEVFNGPNGAFWRVRFKEILNLPVTKRDQVELKKLVEKSS